MYNTRQHDSTGHPTTTAQVAMLMHIDLLPYSLQMNHITSTGLCTTNLLENVLMFISIGNS